MANSWAIVVKRRIKGYPIVDQGQPVRQNDLIEECLDRMDVLRQSLPDHGRILCRQGFPSNSLTTKENVSGTEDHWIDDCVQILRAQLRPLIEVLDLDVSI